MALMFRIIVFTVLLYHCYSFPTYVNTGVILQRVLTSCSTTAIAGNSNRVYAACGSTVYVFLKTNTGLIEGFSVNDYNVTAMRFSSVSNLTSLQATDEALYLYDNPLNTVITCSADDLTSCNSGVQITGSNVASAAVDQYNYIWANGMTNLPQCCNQYNNTVTVSDTSNNFVTSFNLMQYSINQNPLHQCILATTTDDRLYVATGMNITSYAIKRDSEQPAALAFLASYSELKSYANYYLSMTYNSLAQEVIALANNGDILIIGKDGGAYYFALPSDISQPTAIWVDSKTGHLFVTANNWIYTVDISASFKPLQPPNQKLIFRNRV